MGAAITPSPCINTARHLSPALPSSPLPQHISPPPPHPHPQAIDAYEDAAAAATAGIELLLPSKTPGVMRLLGSRHFAQYYKQYHRTRLVEGTPATRARAIMLEKYKNLSVPLLVRATAPCAQPELCVCMDWCMGACWRMDWSRDFPPMCPNPFRPGTPLCPMLPSKRHPLSCCRATAPRIRWLESMHSVQSTGTSSSACAWR
jgi:hypothetical protein